MVRKQLIILFSIPIFLVSMVQVAAASELNFSVSAEIPDNQIDTKQSYFDLHMEQNQTQTLHVTMRNDTKEDVVIEVDVNTAMTNNNGIIDYSQTEFERDPTLEIDIENLIDYEKEVTIKAESSLSFPLHVQMPDESLAGILLGGIHFQEKEKAASENETQAQIENKFAYIIGLKMSMDDLEIDPSLELNEVQATQINYRNAVTANIQNTQPVIVPSLEIKAAVFKEKGETPLFTSQSEDLRMAPHSNFDYAINWENQAFKGGTYRLELSAKSAEYEWEWEEYFTIDGQEAKELNKEAVELETDYTMWYIIGGVIALLGLLALFYWLGTRQKEKVE